MNWRCVILLIGILLGYNVTNAQTFAEWFQQKKTQRKYLAKQIALLQLYAGYLNKGYGVAKQGLGFINDWKNGEFNLHSLFYNSLEKVNPKIRAYARVADCYNNLVVIKSSATRLVARSQQVNLLNEGQKRYVKSSTDRLLADVKQVSQDLLDIITDGTLEETDDERLERIDKLYNQSVNQLTFLRSFSTDVSGMMNASKMERSEMEIMNGLYGLK